MRRWTKLDDAARYAELFRRKRCGRDEGEVAWSRNGRFGDRVRFFLLLRRDWFSFV